MLWIDEQQVTNLPNGDKYNVADSVPITAETRIIAVQATNLPGGAAGFIASSTDGRILTNNAWKCTTSPAAGWAYYDFDDSNWPQATQVTLNGEGDWGAMMKNTISSYAYWIWTSTPNDLTVYCRLR